jgi:hypothetical protein
MMDSALGDKPRNTVSSWISPNAHKGLSSDIADGGLLAIERIDAGEVVAIKGGQVVTTRQLHDLFSERHRHPSRT